MRIQGKEDIPLNDKGREQARRLSRHLSQNKFSAIVSSPLARAWETAKIIAAAHKLTPIAVNNLIEIDFGSLEGKTYEEMDEPERTAMTQWLSNPKSHSIPGGESLLQFRQRLEDGYNEILDNHSSGNLIIVSHAGAIRVLVAGILEIPLAKITRLKVTTASLTIILYDDWGNPYLELFNDVCYLRGEQGK